MSRKRFLALAIVLVTTVVLVMLQLRQRQRNNSLGSSLSPSATTLTKYAADTITTPLDAADTARTAIPGSATSVQSETAATPARLHVRSAAELALPFVEVEDEPGHWRDVPLVEGACDSATLRLPCAIRAPGHVPGMAVRLDEEVVLEADALLVLEGENLKECLLSIEFFAQYGPAVLGGFDRVATFGYTSSDRWAVAVSGSGTVESLGYRQRVDVALTDRTHRLIEVEFRATPGARGTWTVPCEAGLSVAPLEVEIVRPPDAERGELVCNLLIHAERGVLQELTQSWGRVVLQPGLRYTHEGRVAANEDRWQVADVPLREHAVLTVMEEGARANGRLLFIHDGTPQRIQLLAGFTLTGHIGVPAGTALPTRMRMCFGKPLERPDTQSRLEPFSSDMRDVPIGADGAFEVRGPQRVPLWQEISAEPPLELALEIEARGFDLHRSRWPLGAATHVACGTLVLVPSPAPIVLAPGSGFSGSQLDWKTLYSGAGDKDAWYVRCGRAELDGSVALVFDDDWLARNEPRKGRASVSVPELMPHGSAPVAASTDAFVLDIDGDRGRAFVRGANGRYERVEEREYEIQVISRASAEPDSQLTLGWQWRGIPQRLETLGMDRAGRRKTLHFTAPRDGVHLWWSTPGDDDSIADRRAQSVELSSTAATVEIP
jgi:hypothetical protein